MDIEIYSDGSSHFKPIKEAGWATAVLQPDQDPIVYYGYLEGGTNNTGEMLGIMVGACIAKRIKGHTTILSDSEYAIGVLSGQKHAASNLELVSLGKSLLQSVSHGKIKELKWVKGHSGVYGNELADKYAKYGRDQKIMTPNDMKVKYFPDTEAVINFIKGARLWDSVT